MIIKRFGEHYRKTESEPTYQWYELASGERVICDEVTIQKLWSQWIVNKNAYRDDSDTETIFAYYQPQEINLATAENLQKESYEIKEHRIKTGRSKRSIQWATTYEGGPAPSNQP